jgi:TatD DNase family protein
VAVLADTHCHLDFGLFDGDREEVVARALASGIDRILNPGIDLVSSKTAVLLADTHPQLYAAVGVHPNDALSWDRNSIQELRRLASHPKVVAIGEIGLDYYRDYTPHDVQRDVFHRQLDLAADLGLPVVIHNRQATDDVLEILSQWQSALLYENISLAERPGVLHSFSAGTGAALEAIGKHFYIGITGPVTFRNAPELRETVSNLSLSSILIETDAPFLTPQPHRGERNEPAYVHFVAEKISEILERPFDIVASTTSANADRLFGWRENA